MKLTRDFNLSEFDCMDGTEVPISLINNVKELATELQKVRDFTGTPIRIISGFRTKSWNQYVGGKNQSMHLVGKAADIKIQGLEPAEVYELLKIMIKLNLLKNGGLSLYKTFVHYDIGRPRRW